MNLKDNKSFLVLINLNGQLSIEVSIISNIFNIIGIRLIPVKNQLKLIGH